MLKSLTILSLAAAFSLSNAQAPVPSQAPAPEAAPGQSQPPAPIVRGYQADGYHRSGRQSDPAVETVESQPTPGIWLRSGPTSVLSTLSATPQRTEIRLDRGRLNVNVHQPVQHAEILIDLPGGQTSLLKDGLYTFNADTNTVRVLRGEAAYVGPVAGGSMVKPIKIKEDHQISLVAAPGKSELKPVEAYPYELTTDLLPPSNHGEPAYGGGGYGNGYLEGVYGDYPAYGPYPYYAGFWGYPYGYGFYGYPFGYGIGFSYFGGYGYRGGFRR